MPLQVQKPQLTPDEWKILEFHAGKISVNSEEVVVDLTLEQRSTLDSLHVLHYEGLISFISQSLGTNETIVSRITKRGLEVLQEKKFETVRNLTL